MSELPRTRAFERLLVWLELAPNRLAPEWVFLAIALPLGLALVFVTPPFQVPDEQSHFYRAYSISEGVWLAREVGDSVGGDVPASLVETSNALVGALPFHSEVKVDRAALDAAYKTPIDPSRRVDVTYAGAAVYFPFVYLTQAVGMALARGFDLAALWTLLLGRLVTMLAAVALTWLAVRWMPVQRWAMVLLAISPMVAFLRSSVSADATTTAVALLLTAALIRELAGEGDIALGRWALIFGLSLAIGLCKLNYFLIAGACVLIPATRFRSTGARIAACAALFLTAAVPALAWSRYATRFYRAPGPDSGVAPQLHYIAEHPVSALWVWLKAPLRDGRTYLDSAFARLGWLDTPLPRWTLVAMVALLLVVAVLERASPRVLGVRQRLVAGAVVATAGLSIIATLYLAWAPTGSPTAEGVQGRYFLPLVPVGLLTLAGLAPSVRRREAWLATAVGCFLAIAPAAMLTSLMRRYWG